MSIFNANRQQENRWVLMQRRAQVSVFPGGNTSLERTQDAETKRVLRGRRPLGRHLWSLQGQRLRGNQLRTVPGPPEALQGDELEGSEGQGARVPLSSRPLTPPDICPHVHPAQLSPVSHAHI